MKFKVAVFLVLYYLLPLKAVQVSPQMFVFEGRAYTASDSPLLDTNVTFNFKIFDPSKTCILYEEAQTGINLSDSNGFFALGVGSKISGEAKRTGNDPGLTMKEVFQNSSVVTGKTAAGSSCSYTPSAGHQKVMIVKMTPASGTEETFPDIVINSVPQALVAETLQGILPSGFVQITGNVTQANVATLTDAGDASTLHHHDGRYLSSSSAAGLAASSYANGNFGIGTSSPSSHLSFGGNTDRTIGVERNSTTDGADFTITAGGAASGSTNKAGGDLVLSSGTATGSGSSKIEFKTVNAGGSGTTDRTPSTVMTILGSGNVGIGTTTPDTAFDLAGAFSVRAMVAPAVAPASQGRIYFDSTANRFKISENAGSYLDLSNLPRSCYQVSTTSSSIFADRTLADMVDGTFDGEAYFSDAIDPSNHWLKFQFSQAVTITSAAWYQDVTASHGSWKWQGSNNNSTWTDIGANFTLGGALIQTQTALNGNATAYSYYRLSGVSGSTSDSPYLLQIVFSNSGGTLAICDQNKWEAIASDIYYKSGKVMVGNDTYLSAPAAKLHIHGSTMAGYETVLLATNGDGSPDNRGATIAIGTENNGPRAFIQGGSLKSSDGFADPNASGVVHGFNFKVWDPAANIQNIAHFTAVGNNNLRVVFLPNNNGRMGIGTYNPETTLQVAGIISPSADNTYTLGTGTRRFSDVYSVNAANNTSDEREKKRIKDSDLGLSFINRLRPVSYYWKFSTDVAQHYGFLAQETQEALVAEKSTSQSAFPIVTHDESSDRFGIRYTELIAPLVKALQEMYALLTGLDKDLMVLKRENETLKTYLCQRDPSAPFCIKSKN